MPKLIYANTKNSDMYYAVKHNITDPFFYLEIDDRKYVFLDYREIKAFEEKNKNPKIKAILSNDLINKSKELNDKTSRANKLAFIILKEFNLLDEIINVPENFSLGMADYLRSREINISPVSSFFPDRKKKNSREINFIKENISKTLKAFEKIEFILRESQIKWDKILFQWSILTSEFLKSEIEILLFREGMFSSEWIIISSWNQTAIPHHWGHGEIRPNSLIICDIFPKSRSNEYFADITRTYVKWKASQRMLDIFNIVEKAQNKVIESIKPWVENRDIHNICKNIFDDSGFITKWESGFVHGTGHSFGLDIHENPNLNGSSEDILEVWNILTVEPGLYFPELWGVRLEDDVLVTENGVKNLVEYPKMLVIE